eukprot:35440_1
MTVKQNKILCSINNILTNFECDSILNKIKNYESNMQSMKHKYDENIRNSDRLLIIDQSFSTFLWKRLENLLNKICENHSLSIVPLGFDVLTIGTEKEWKLHGINDGIRINRYKCNSNHQFSYHKDAQYCSSADERSIYSLVIYLNHNFIGGETKFYFENNDKKNNLINDYTIKDEITNFGGIDNYEMHTIKPKKGCAVLFSHALIHCGCRVKTNNINNDLYKYILRTDIIVKRISKRKGFAVSSDESKYYLKCLNYFRNAQQFELNGNKKQANIFYEKSLNLRYSFPFALTQNDYNKLPQKK